MGEIGITRREFLYEMRWWEILMASRGYNRRNILTHQLLRLAGYSAFYAFRENKEGKEPQQWVPLWFDDADELPDISDDDISEMNGLINSINGKLTKKKAPKKK